MSGLDEKEQIEPCGGCGEADPSKRCINCHHEFFPNRRPLTTPADAGEEPVAWQWRCRAVERDRSRGPWEQWREGRKPEFRGGTYEAEERPLYSATALERVVRDRDALREQIAHFGQLNQEEQERNLNRATLRARLETVEAETRGPFKIGDRVTKISGASWTGTVCGTYSTKLTPIGYAVESENEPGSVQIYPAQALSRFVSDNLEPRHD